MGEFDDKLNALLNNPDSMAQIMQLAQSLGGGTAAAASPSGGTDTAGTPPPQSPASAPAWTPPPSAPGGDILSSLTGGLDPKLLARLAPLVGELSSTKNSSARQLLYALRPYLKPERQEKVERALQLAKLIHLGKKFLSESEG